MRQAWLKFFAPIVALVWIVATAGCQATAARPKNVILMISDGMGPSAVTLTRLVNGKGDLVLDQYLIGARRTSSQDKIVTDSAAAATAMSAGRLTKNDYVAVTSSGQPLGTVLEAAKFQKNMATGLVAKSRITHATPAGFSSHVMNRDDESRIAAQQLGLRMDVMFGGGTDFFLPKSAGGERSDSRNLLNEARQSGFQVITTADELAGDLRPPLLALFSDSGMQYEIDRAATKEPSLEDMTRFALYLLAQREGFFLMIEGSEIDHTCHDNDAGSLVPEVLAYDAAFAAAVEFARRDGRTLVISTSDHDTGGLSITGGDVGNAKSGPLRLRSAKASADAMVTMITKGRTLEDVLKEYAGVTNVTDAEKESYVAATPGVPADLQKRRKIALGKIVAAHSSLRWSHTEHTAVDVNVYGYGPGMELFRGAQSATATAAAIAELLGLDMAEATREARERIKGDVGKPG